MTDPTEHIPPIHGHGINRRHKRLWALHDFSRGRGLEIGPLHNRAIYPEQADVHYLDVFGQEQLRSNYAGHPNVVAENIPEIEYVLFDGERVRDLSETIGADEGFDWVVASHVIEHVPDVISWLAEIAKVTVDDGRLVLVVPDRRYCFDIHRPGTTVGQMLLEHELGARVPSVRAVYDAKRSHAGRPSVPGAWRGEVPGYDTRMLTLDQVLTQVDRSRAGEYVDCHAWTFTPGSLVEQIVELRRLGLAEWMVEALTPTPRNQLEFFVVLRRLARGTDWSAADLDGEVPFGDLPDWLEESSRWQRRLRRTRAKLKRKQARIAALEVQLARTRAKPAKAPASPLARLRRRVRRAVRVTPR